MYDVLDHGFDIAESLEDNSRVSAPEKTCLYLCVPSCTFRDDRLSCANSSLFFRVSPTEVSVDIIVKDFSSEPPKYGRAEVFFTAGASLASIFFYFFSSFYMHYAFCIPLPGLGLSEKLLQKLAQSAAAPFLSVLRELNLEYLGMLNARYVA
jgi:hypothetical protein